ncbi:hypothetical protein [Actinomadura sp. 3N508]|uniref:hypothetical protein n=1 Tax=Actinomadura sp. 3N508 TaxID=3375153 RepID=UPI0037891556
MTETIAEARVISVGQGISLLPLTGALLDEVVELDGDWKVPADFGRVLADCSATGPVAYVEAEYFGGTGSQAAQVWDAGEIVLGPLHVAEGERWPEAGSPISQALRRLGVDKGEHFDEFDAVGLGRHRDTGGWLSLFSE